MYYQVLAMQIRYKSACVFWLSSRWSSFSVTLRYSLLLVTKRNPVVLCILQQSNSVAGVVVTIIYTTWQWMHGHVLLCSVIWDNLLGFEVKGQSNLMSHNFDNCNLKSNKQVVYKMSLCDYCGWFLSGYIFNIHILWPSLRARGPAMRTHGHLHQRFRQQIK